MCLGEVGIDLAPLLAGAGVLGVALGFGSQSLVKDFLSGMFILVEDQFGVGDIVDVGEASGTVEAVSLRTTRLRAIDGTVWHVPNGEIHRVGNMSQHWSRALLDIEVAYDTVVDHARAVIKRVADAVWQEDDGVLEEPELWGVEQLGAHGVMLRLVVKTTPSQQWRVSRELRERIKARVRRGGDRDPVPAADRLAPPRRRSVARSCEMPGMDRISWFPVPDEADLPPELQGLFRKARERIGFVPNVFRTYAFRPERLSAWFAHFRMLHEETPGLSAAEREMIAVVVSMANGCLYCLVAHGAALREAWGDPVMADRITLDWRRADGADDRQRAICAMAERLTLTPLQCTEPELDELRCHGLSDEDAWDVIEVAAMYNFTNRLALATGQMPNPEYHSLAR